MSSVHGSEVRSGNHAAAARSGINAAAARSVINAAAERSGSKAAAARSDTITTASRSGVGEAVAGSDIITAASRSSTQEAAARSDADATASGSGTKKIPERSSAKAAVARSGATRIIMSADLSNIIDSIVASILSRKDVVVAKSLGGNQNDSEDAEPESKGNHEETLSKEDSNRKENLEKKNIPTTNKVIVKEISEVDKQNKMMKNSSFTSNAKLKDEHNINKITETESYENIDYRLENPIDYDDYYPQEANDSIDTYHSNKNEYERDEHEIDFSKESNIDDKNGDINIHNVIDEIFSNNQQVNIENQILPKLINENMEHEDHEKKLENNIINSNGVNIATPQINTKSQSRQMNVTEYVSIEALARAFQLKGNDFND